MKLGSEKDILEKINQTLCMIREEKNNEVRLALYNYIGNLYSALSVIRGKKVYPNKKKIFGSNDDYKRFNKKTGYLFDKFDDNFVENLEFHKDLFYSVAFGTEKLFVDMVSQNVEYSNEGFEFSENEFITVFYDFCKSIGIEHLFLDLLKKKKIYSMTKGTEYDRYDGLTLFNPVTGDTDILVNEFKYDIRSMFTLAHEMGHLYDGVELVSSGENINHVRYIYNSVYNEVFSRLFERLFIEYLIKNNIGGNDTIDRLVDMIINNHEYFLSAYVVSLLDAKYIKRDKYLNLSPESLTDMVKEHFTDLTIIEDLLKSNSINLAEEVNYTYGDFVSMFLKESIIDGGLESSEIKDFLSIRTHEFDRDFIESHDYTSDRYIELYKKEIQLVKKK